MSRGARVGTRIWDGFWKVMLGMQAGPLSARLSYHQVLEVPEKDSNMAGE